ncbi:uncharacterized protein [Spinacia oleracea]|uniref:Uncharacterized protein n=1 Tax=Spinacia oleracea TaxID=3562 RepID=A0ABM3R0D6_SPIOL|nr:uncharacterized protein LOC130463845 [Spinacia oleracea]
MLKVWTKDEISKARSEDKVDGGDYGFLECLDVAYGESHIHEARDSDCLSCMEEDLVRVTTISNTSGRIKQRRRRRPTKILTNEKRKKLKGNGLRDLQRMKQQQKTHQRKEMRGHVMTWKKMKGNNIKGKEMMRGQVMT